MKRSISGGLGPSLLVPVEPDAFGSGWPDLFPLEHAPQESFVVVAARPSARRTGKDQALTYPPPQKRPAKRAGCEQSPLDRQSDARKPRAQKAGAFAFGLTKSDRDHYRMANNRIMISALSASFPPSGSLSGPLGVPQLPPGGPSFLTPIGLSRSRGGTCAAAGQTAIAHVHEGGQRFHECGHC
jgi:hypothetical protein